MTAPRIDGPMRAHFERGIALACDDVRAGVFRRGGPEREYLSTMPVDHHDEDWGPGVNSHLACETAEELAFLAGYSAIVWLLDDEGAIKVSFGVPFALLGLSASPVVLDAALVVEARRAARDGAGGLIVDTLDEAAE